MLIKNKNNKGYFFFILWLKKGVVYEKEIFIFVCFAIILFSSSEIAFGPSSTPLFDGIDVSEYKEYINYSEVINNIAMYKY